MLDFVTCARGCDLGRVVDLEDAVVLFPRGESVERDPSCDVDGVSGCVPLDLTPVTWGSSCAACDEIASLSDVFCSTIIIKRHSLYRLAHYSRLKMIYYCDVSLLMLDMLRVVEPGSFEPPVSRLKT